MFGLLKFFKKEKPAQLATRPFWLCGVCAHIRGGWMSEKISWIVAKCDDCKKIRQIADPRDFHLHGD